MFNYSIFKVISHSSIPVAFNLSHTVTLFSKNLLPIGTQHVVSCPFRKTGFNNSVLNRHRIIYLLKFKSNLCIAGGATDFKCKNKMSLLSLRAKLLLGPNYCNNIEQLKTLKSCQDKLKPVSLKI